MPNQDKKPYRIDYNYQPAISDGKEIFAEDYQTRVVGESSVESIVEHKSQG